MKILCVSDQIDPLVYSNSIKDRFGDVDLVLCAGDLPLDYLDFIVSSINKPLYFVFGNHDLKGYAGYKRNGPLQPTARELKGIGAAHIGSRICREAGLIIAGLGGSMLYNNGANQYTNGSMYWEILKLLPAMLVNRIFRGRFVDILLTHAAPLGIHDKNDQCHRGFEAFLRFMRLFKPKYLIHGHIHLYDRSSDRATQYQQTLVLNAYSHYVLACEELP